MNKGYKRAYRSGEWEITKFEGNYFDLYHIPCKAYQCYDSLKTRNKFRCLWCERKIPKRVRRLFSEFCKTNPEYDVEL